ncbi:MAG: hypothetical protein WA161_17765 [Pseudomonas sp.]|uniref:hypothetical protein n=1 Tax=Pseudomonas sp. TaxID=306 RepID=UPI003BB63E4D
MSRLFLDPLRAALLGMSCSISPALCAVSLRHPRAPAMLAQAAVAPAVPPSAFADALKKATRDAAQ